MGDDQASDDDSEGGFEWIGTGEADVSPAVDRREDTTDSVVPETDLDQTDDGGRGDPFAEGAFDDVEPEAVDAEGVWEDLSAATLRGSVTDDGETTYAQVSKHRFCERCEHFSEPPAVSCSHEGTEILEFLDMETVHLVDCPIVAERREIGYDE